MKPNLSGVLPGVSDVRGFNFHSEVSIFKVSGRRAGESVEFERAEVLFSAKSMSVSFPPRAGDKTGGLLAPPQGRI